jgi:hypothetical protein
MDLILLYWGNGIHLFFFFWHVLCDSFIHIEYTHTDNEEKNITCAILLRTRNEKSMKERKKKGKTPTDYLHAWSVTLAHARFLLYKKGDKNYVKIGWVYFQQFCSWQYIFPTFLLEYSSHLLKFNTDKIFYDHEQ